MGKKEDPIMMKRGFSQNDAVQLARKILSELFPEKADAPVAFGYGSLKSGDVIISPIGLKNWDKEVKSRLSELVTSMARQYVGMHKTTSLANQSGENGAIAVLADDERMWLVAGLVDDENVRCAIAIASAAGDLTEEKAATLARLTKTLFLD